MTIFVKFYLLIYRFKRDFSVQFFHWNFVIPKAFKNTKNISIRLFGKKIRTSIYSSTDIGAEQRKSPCFHLVKDGKQRLESSISFSFSQRPFSLSLS